MGNGRHKALSLEFRSLVSHSARASRNFPGLPASAADHPGNPRYGCVSRGPPCPNPNTRSSWTHIVSCRRRPSCCTRRGRRGTARDSSSCVRGRARSRRLAPRTTRSALSRTGGGCAWRHIGARGPAGSACRSHFLPNSALPKLLGSTCLQYVTQTC